MATNDPTLAGLVAAQLRKYPSLDPRAVLAIAGHEGLGGGVGDNGTSFGPFQLHFGGAYPKSAPQNAQDAQKWAWSPAGIDYALQRIQSVAGGLKGLPAITAISTRFERPANPNAEISDAASHYGGALNMNGGPSQFTPGRPGSATAPPTSGGVTGGLGQMPMQQMSPMLRALMASQMGQTAQDYITGNFGAANNSIMSMMSMRNALQNADSFGLSTASAPASVHASSHGVGGPNTAPKALNGTFQMQTGGKSPYSNLRFASGVDWMHVNPRLLKSVNAVAASHGVVVDINSGYRSNAHSQQVGGFAGDPHTKGLAIDGYVNGKPVGDVLPANIWSKYGVQSGAVPNFYHGQSDPEHLQL